MTSSTRLQRDLMRAAINRWKRSTVMEHEYEAKEFLGIMVRKLIDDPSGNNLLAAAEAIIGCSNLDHDEMSVVE